MIQWRIPRQRLHRLGLLAISLITLSLTLTPISGRIASAQPTENFVKRTGTQFTLDGKPFFVTGANNHYLSWGSQEEIDNVLNDAAAMHFNVIRTFSGPVIGSLDKTSIPTIWTWKNPADSSNMNTNGVYYLYWDTQTDSMAWNDGEDGLQKLDYVVSQAQKLQIKVLISILDFWEYTGGSQQMRAWYGSTDTGKDRYTFFFTDPRTQQNYKDWAKHLLEHVNFYSNIAYKDDPTILGWDLMNEPQASSVALAQSWIAEMSAYVKSIDPNHLVASGSEGFYGNTAGSEPNTELVIPTIDFGTWHISPLHHHVTPDQVTDLIAQHCATAAKVNKPVLLEEFDYGSDNADQSQAYQNWTAAAANNPNCAGWLVWRLTAKQDSGNYPADNHDKFDIHNDGSSTAEVLINAAQNGAAQSHH